MVSEPGGGGAGSGDVVGVFERSVDGSLLMMYIAANMHYPKEKLENPLYLHPSKGPGSLVVHEKLVGAQSFRSWKRSIEIGLSTKRKLGFVRGTVIRMNDQVQAELWDTCNNVVISWIMNFVSDSIAKSIMFVGTASEIWNQLEKRFALSNGSRKYKLNREIYSFEQKGSSIIRNFLNALSSHKEELRLFQFLNGLDEYFSSQRSKILLMNPLPTVESACSLLQQEESQRELVQNSSSSMKVTALYSKANLKDKCSICGFKWHPPERWYSGFKGNQSNRKVAATTEGGNIMFTPQQFQQLMKSLPQFDLKGNNSDEELDHTFAAGKFCLLAADSLLINYWIFDTRATNHMTPFLKNLINAAKLLFQPKINLPNGFTSFITHTGTVKLNNEHDWTTKRVLALGKQRSGLYFLLNIPLKSIDARLQSLIVSTCATASFFLILLGHISDSKLQYVTCVPNSTLKSNTISCVSRPMAKFTKLPYELSDSHASEIFDLIHIDIWGPYKVVTNGKYKYFLTIVDDCSRVTWTYLLFQKSDAFSFLKSFISFVSNQFNETVKTVRSDNALEFVIGPCHLFLAEQGIVHQTSCVDRPQQNARVERKHRHILEIARALRDVTFYEEIFPYFSTSISKFLKPLPCGLPHYLNPLSFNDFISNTISSNAQELFAYDTPASPSAEPSVSVPATSNQSNSIPSDTQGQSMPTENLQGNTSNSHAPIRQSTRHSKPPNWLKDYVTKLPNGPMANQVSTPMLHNQFQDFLCALALEDNETWDVVTLPHGKKAIGSHWIFKSKFRADGSVERKKARLVIQGNRQRKGVDYEETFAPVAKMATLRSLLVVVAMNGWEKCQMDVSNVFLHGDLLEEVYMRMPPGYVGKGKCVQNVTNSTSLVCKLKKSLYGLKQAPRQWFFKLSSALLSFDDLLITSSDPSQIQQLKDQLSSTFHMKDLVPLNYFLGIEVTRADQGIFISHKKYTLEILKEYGVQNAKPYKLLKDHNLKLQADMGSPLADPETYKKLIGKLIYLTVTRLDICYTVQLLSQFMQNPTSIHMQAAKHLLRYLINCTGQGVVLTHKPAAYLTAYCDSDWASCPMSRRSTTGYCILLGEFPISWKSKKQVVVARSSAETEYRAMALTCCEVTWVVSLLKDIGLTDLGPADLHCDNQAALHIAANLVFHARTKHIEVDCHFVRDQIKAGLVKPSYVNTKLQLADVFTKVISVDQHKLRLCTWNKVGVSQFFLHPPIWRGGGV
ncbi:retrovirus-related pol polyprotein from transposon TNT 1-94 [Tanacetum coccineum]